MNPRNPVSRPRRAWPLRRQLLVLILVVAVPLVSLMGYNLYHSFEWDKHVASANAFNLVRITAANTEIFLDDARRVLETLAQRPAILALDRKACDPLPADILRLYPRFHNVLTVDRNSTLVCSAIALAPGTPAKQDPVDWFNPVRKNMRFTIGTPAVDFISGQWRVTLAYPLRDTQGEFTGAVGISIDMINYPLLPTTAGLPKDAVVAIGSYSGTIIARTPDAKNFVGRKTMDSPSRSAALAAKTGQIEEVGPDGIRRIYGFTAIPGTDWYALAGLPAQAVYAGSHAAFVRSILLTLAILPLVAAGALAMGRRIDRPLRRITDVAGTIAAGDRTARAPLVGSRETVALAAQLNAMLDTLDASERRFRETLKNIRLIAVALDAQGRVNYCNDFLLELSGWQRAEVLGRDWFETFLPDPAPVRALFEQGIREGNLLLHYENEIVTHQGLRRLIRWNNTILRDPADRIIGTVSLGEDITERRQADVQVRDLLAKEHRAGAALLNLLEDQKQSATALRELSRRLLEVEENERRAISRELHDRIGQDLSAINLSIDLMGMQLPDEMRQALQTRLNDLRALAQSSIDNTRDIMADLHPAGLDDSGLAVALQYHSDRISQRLQIPVTVNNGWSSARPAATTELAVFRIAQEGINNIAKHAGACNILIDLEQDATTNRRTLRISDDGKGFDTATSKPLNHGLRTMRERAQAVGATLHVDSVPGRGTRISVELPTGAA